MTVYFQNFLFIQVVVLLDLPRKTYKFLSFNATKVIYLVLCFISLLYDYFFSADLIILIKGHGTLSTIVNWVYCYITQEYNAITRPQPTPVINVILCSFRGHHFAGSLAPWFRISHDLVHGFLKLGNRCFMKWNSDSLSGWQKTPWMHKWFLFLIIFFAEVILISEFVSLEIRITSKFRLFCQADRLPGVHFEKPLLSILFSCLCTVLLRLRIKPD